MYTFVRIMENRQEYHWAPDQNLQELTGHNIISGWHMLLGTTRRRIYIYIYTYVLEA